MHLTCSETGIVAEACDGKRFSRAVERVGAEHFTATLNRRFASKLLEIIDGESVVDLSEDASAIAAKSGRVRLIGPKIQVAFPGLGDAMAPKTGTAGVLPSSALLSAIGTLRTVNEDATVIIDFARDRVRLSVRSEEGGAVVPLPCVVQGPEMSRSTSLRNLRAACQSLDAQQAALSIVDATHAMIRLEASDECSDVAWVLASRIQ